ncbi:MULTISPECIES: potassium/proton antiporter [Photobacterium]|uniref:Sodium:proton exchanger n=1 Tax=Photobacterium ganghwense TaxID=320778 RepID=A0A0J1HFQ8_9GAMM|nr:MULTISPECIES: potassium/proton antiporter [Photobacterium]KLV10434.1 sodium:proton exchanger [Photobacterium ganghwense]PSU09669.1 potassium/proton antiporter [Photobacterium ganghwense]
MTLQIAFVLMACLVALGILLHQPSKTLGIPSLLIFIGVGLMFGNGEFNFIYDNLALTSLIGSIALNVIVFVGGLNTSTSAIRVAFKEGGILSTIGVLLTTVLLGGMLYFITDFNFLACLLFAAVVSSTDAAAVFSILESKKLKLKHNTDTVLEFESATNDPVALLMVTILTGILAMSGDPVTVGSITVTLLQQVVVGLLVGYAVGKICVGLLNAIKLEEYGLIPVFVMACFFIATYGGELLGGNILIASYVSGVMIGNNLQRGREVSRHFFNSVSWLAQALMFIILGLQFFPKELFSDALASILPAIALIFVARPAAVFLSYLPFRKVERNKKLFISAIGLKGATPIVFALIPAAAGVEGAQQMAHMVFFIVLISVVLQGAALEPLADKLGLRQDEETSA